MIDDLIRSFRSVDAWPTATATVFSSETVSDGGTEQGPPTVRITFSYRANSGAIHSGSFTADSLTSLYNLSVGDTFPIHFNPQSPSKFYVAGLSSWFTNMRLAFWVLVLGTAALLLIVCIWKCFSVGRWS